jgi:excisionase family DNA binding protein
MEQLPDLMTVAEVAAAARVSDETIHRWVRLGRLSCVKLPSGLKRFNRAEVESMLSGESNGNAA